MQDVRMTKFLITRELQIQEAYPGQVSIMIVGLYFWYLESGTLYLRGNTESDVGFAVHIPKDFSVKRDCHFLGLVLRGTKGNRWSYVIVACEESQVRQTECQLQETSSPDQLFQLEEISGRFSTWNRVGVCVDQLLETTELQKILMKLTLKNLSL